MYFNPRGILTLILLVSFFLFLPIFSVFLSADDFYNIRLIMGNSWTDIAATFAFDRNEQFLFYRPLTTQLYYFVLYPLFGLHALGYHIISFLFFVALVLLMYVLSLKLTKNKTTALLTAAFYAFSSSNLTRLAWSVQIQELGFGLFTMSCVIAWIYYLEKKHAKFLIFSVVFFIFSLMSKETAVVVPLILGIVTIILIKPLKKIIKYILPLGLFFILLLPYLYLRFIVMGVSTGDHYFTAVSIQSIINTLLWFVLWAIGLPEELVNLQIFGPGVQLNPEMIRLVQTQMPWVGIGFILFSAFVLMALAAGFSIKSFRSNDSIKIILFGATWFLVSLVPHLFSPFHKFAYSLTVPLFATSLLLAFISTVLLTHKRVWTSIVAGGIVISYMLLSWSTIRIEENLHWVFLRSTMVKRVFNHMDNYKMVEATTLDSVVFVNDISPVNNPYGVSKQLSVALSDDAFMQLYFNNPTFQTYYEDTEEISVEHPRSLLLPSSQFIQ